MTKRGWQALFVPGGILLFAVVALLQGEYVTIAAPAIDVCYFAAFAATALLAWRFKSSRVILASATLLLAHRALVFFSDGRIGHSGPGRIAFEVIALLLPLDFLMLGLTRERGLNVTAVSPYSAIVFAEAVFVAILCRPGQITSPSLFRVMPLSSSLFAWTRIPQTALLMFVVAAGFFLFQLLQHHQPTENGLLWSMISVFAALQSGGVGRLSSAYFAAAGVILAATVVENTYHLAYHDELTGLPGRRAFNDALPGLREQYTVAVVDIDHFKNFNDTWGHDTGDQVLRMVASRLARVTGGGFAYRVGGEEFSILFPGKSVKDTVPHLESLRAAVEASSFQVRGIPERRSEARGSDRRQATKKRRQRSFDRSRNLDLPFVEQLSVTVSIGAAEPGAKLLQVEHVIEAADKALYRAKEGGRNRVEVAGPSRRRASRLKRSIA